MGVGFVCSECTALDIDVEDEDLFQEYVAEGWFSALIVQFRLIADAAYAPKTMQGYAYHLRRFLQWGHLTGVRVLPASYLILCLYLSYLVKTGLAYSSITQASKAISLWHGCARLSDPTADSYFKLWLKGVQRICSRKSVPKVGYQMTHILSLMSFFEGFLSHGSFGQRARALRDRARVLIGFFGWRRNAECMKFRICDLVFHDDNDWVAFWVCGTKNDPFDGTFIYLSNLTACGIPIVTHLRQYYDLLVSSLRISDPRSCTQPFLQSFTSSFTGNQWSSFPQRLQILNKSALFFSVDEAKLYGSHSLRRGGCTHAWQQGIVDRVIQAHGLWSSFAYKLYQEVNRKQLLGVTQSM